MWGSCSINQAIQGNQIIDTRIVGCVSTIARKCIHQIHFQTFKATPPWRKNRGLKLAKVQSNLRSPKPTLLMGSKSAKTNMPSHVFQEVVVNHTSRKPLDASVLTKWGVTGTEKELLPLGGRRNCGERGEVHIIKRSSNLALSHCSNGS